MTEDATYITNVLVIEKRGNPPMPIAFIAKDAIKVANGYEVKVWNDGAGAKFWTSPVKNYSDYYTPASSHPQHSDSQDKS